MSKYNHSRKRRRLAAMWNVQDGKCIYCDHHTWLRDLSHGHDTKSNPVRGINQYEATIEHIRPKACGGSKLSKSNLIASCKRCNTTRGTLPHFIFKWASIRSYELALRCVKIWETWRRISLFVGKTSTYGGHSGLF